MTQPWQGWYPGREPFLQPLASPGGSSGAGVREREEGRRGEFPRLSCSFHKSPQSRWRRSREVRGAGAQRGGTRHLPFPHRFLSFCSFLLLLSFFLFFKPPPLPSRSGGCPGPAARLPLRLRWVLPAALAAAASQRPDSGKRKLGGSGLAPRLSDPRGCTARAPHPGSGAAVLPDATASRGPRGGPGDRLGGRFLSRPPPEPLMVAARAPAL